MSKYRKNRIESIMLIVHLLMKDLEELKDEEQEYLDTMSENFHGTERYEKIRDNINYLDAAYDDMNDVLDNLNEAVS